MLLDHDKNMAHSLEDLMRSASILRTPSLEVGALVYLHFGHDQPPHIAFLLVGVGDRRLEHLFDQSAGPLAGKPQRILSGVDALTTNQIRNSIRLDRASPESGAARYGLFVSPDDIDSAKEVDRKHWIKGAPEHAASYRYSEQELAGTCPACETAVPQGAAECPECGLVVGTAETAECPACEADVPADAEKCPNCGVEFE